MKDRKSSKLHGAIVWAAIASVIVFGFIYVFVRESTKGDRILLRTPPANVFASERPVHPDAVNINTAGKDELMALPGIGPSIADGIIRFREENGPFRDKAEIMDVSGIGEEKYKDLQDLITAD